MSKKKERLISADRLKRHYSWWTGPMELTREDLDTIVDMQPDAAPAWIPVRERLPEDTYPVNITWVNHDPAPYYATLKDKPFTATGCYCDGKWYWYSVICQDYLDEFRCCDVDSMASSIEVIAWMPLPEPYKGGE